MQASSVAVNSDWRSGDNGNPAEISTTIFLPGTVRKFLASDRSASNIVRAP
jgi:hypothetical protein